MDIQGLVRALAVQPRAKEFSYRPKGYMAICHVTLSTRSCDGESRGCPDSTTREPQLKITCIVLDGITLEAREKPGQAWGGLGRLEEGLGKLGEVWEGLKKPGEARGTLGKPMVHGRSTLGRPRGNGKGIWKG